MFIKVLDLTPIYHSINSVGGFMEPVFSEVTIKNEPGSNVLTNRYIDGKCTWFREDGSICEVASYLMGMLHGENVVYNLDGTIKSYVYYSFGKPLKSLI